MVLKEPNDLEISKLINGLERGQWCMVLKGHNGH